MGMSASYLRRPVDVHVRFAREAGSIETLEGVVAYQASDAILTGTRGEQWPVHRPRFEQAYEPAQAPLEMGDDGVYRRKPLVVTAWQTAAALSVPLSGARGVLVAKPGDWIVKGPEGDEWVVADAIFHDTYTPVEPE